MYQLSRRVTGCLSCFRRLCHLLFLLCSTTVCLSGVNLLPNGSFERRSFDGVPDRWTPAFGGETAVLTGVPTRCGNRVLRLTDNSTTLAAGVYSEAIPTGPGVSYTAEAYAMSSSGASSTPRLYLKFFDAAGTEVGSSSAGGTAAPGQWEYLSATAIAPVSASTVKVLCYSLIGSTGSFYFDGVSLRAGLPGPMPGEQVRFVAPAAEGSGSGLSSTQPAKYNNTTFWNGIKASLLTNAVRVVFLEGEYVVNQWADRLLLSRIGNDAYPLTLEGQRPYGTVFTRNNAAQTNDGPATLHLQYATNVVVRHLHWENDTTVSGRLVQYGLAINGSAAVQTRNITVEGCSFVGLVWNIYGAMGFHHAATKGGRVLNCEFVRGGFSAGFHMIYNAYGAHDLLFENNYFQDSTGSYLRLRAGCHEAVVRSNEFVSTAAAYNLPFLHMPTFNDIEPGDETWGRNFKFLNNKFEYMVDGGANVAVQFSHSGFDPYRAPGILWDYLLTTQEAAILSSSDVHARKELVRTNFGINLDTQLELSGNVRLGNHKMDMELVTKSNSSYNYQDADGVWHLCPNYGGNGAWDISDLLGLPVVPTTNSWKATANSNWDNPANWAPSRVPNGIGSMALLTNNSPGPSLTNTLDSAVTLGTLRVGSLNGTGNVVLEASRGSTLTMNNSGNGAEIIAVSGSPLDSINLPIELGDELTISNSKTLSVRGPITELGPLAGYGAPRSLTKTGAGTLVLQGDNSFSGGLYIKEGMVNGPGKLGIGPVILGDTAGTNSAWLLGAGTYTNAIFVAYGSTGSKWMANTGTAANVTFAGPITLQGEGTFHAGQNTGYTLISGPITGTGSVRVITAQGGANFVRLSNSNTFSGGVILDSGTLRIEHDAALGSGALTVLGGTLAAANTFARTLSNPVIVSNDFTIGQSTAPGALTLSGPITLGAATRTVTIANFNSTFSGPISGEDAGFVKTGTGLLTLKGTNTYTGATLIDQGALFVNGIVQNSPLTASSSTTLGGTGLIYSPVLIEAGATLAPGSPGIGSLTISNSLSLIPGSTTLLEINRSAGVYDHLEGTTINYGGTLTIANLSGSFTGGESYRLFRANQRNGNFSATNLPPLAPDLAWIWDPDQGTLSVSSAPALTPTNLTFVVSSNGSLDLRWPASHRGWLLQSNVVNIADANHWFDIPGSQTMTNLLILPDPFLPNVFFRLRLP